MNLADARIETVVTPIDSFKVRFLKDPQECRGQTEIDCNTRMELPDGRVARVSPRFWNSFCSLFNLNRSIFEYFGHGEVFARINQVKDTNVRVAIETNTSRPEDDPTILSCTNPSKPILPLDDVRRLVEEYHGNRSGYHQGMVDASFDAPYPLEFKIGGDDFRTRFSMSMPVDGYGLPSAYLEMLRQVCQNGAVAVSRAFRTQFQLGKEDSLLYNVLDRAMTSFNNEEGYHSYKLRIEAATRSWASYNEFTRIHDLTSKAMLHDGKPLEERNQILLGLLQRAGNPLEWFGMTSGREISDRKARTIPVKITVYDLFNFASEIATHHVTGRENRNRLNAWIGDTVTKEYDLEDTLTTHPDYADFFTTPAARMQAAAPNN
jgi:hypothetical protein